MLAAHADFVDFYCRQELLVRQEYLICDAGRLPCCVLQNVTEASSVCQSHHTVLCSLLGMQLHAGWRDLLQRELLLAAKATLSQGLQLWV